MRFVAGQWVTHEGDPVELLEPEIVLHTEEPEETPDPRETKPARKDPRKAKGAQ